MSSLDPKIDGCQTVDPSLATEGSLPCLFSNNSADRATQRLQMKTNRLSTQHKKSASALSWNVKSLSEKFGIERLGFLTLTFADHVIDYKEAQRRFNNLRKHVLKVRYSEYIRVLERQKSGRIHYHLLVVLPSDIRTGFDFDAIANHDYKSANSCLRSEWSFWRLSAKKYGFGRTELMPIKSTHEGIARYVGKYISKHIDQRQIADKGARLVEYSRGARIATTKYSFVSDSSKLWRLKVAHFAKIMGETIGEDLHTTEDLAHYLGKRWAYEYREIILTIPDHEVTTGYQSSARQLAD